MDASTAARLEAAWKGTPWHGPPDASRPRNILDLNLRLRRVLSWFARADEHHRGGDHDTAFILYWIAFNAAYGRIDLPQEQSERETLRRYFRTVTGLNQSLRGAIRKDNAFQSQAMDLLGSKYVFEPFWKHHNRTPGSGDWASRLARSRNKARGLMKNVLNSNVRAADNLAEILDLLFARLYTLRNQLLHGGATWSSSKNRAQVRTGTAIMAALMPYFIEAMIENPDADWGAPRYPVVND